MGEGRERRRRGPLNRLRRLVYGVALSASLPATASEPAAAPAVRATVVVESSAQKILFAGIEGLLRVNAETAATVRVPPAADDDYADLAFEDLRMEMDDPRGDSALRVTVMQPTLLRDGLGLDLAIPDLGALRLNLYARREGKAAGPRVLLVSSRDADGQPAWSLGGSLELVRTTDGARQLSFVPELCVDGDALTGRNLGFSAAVRYSHWRGLPDSAARDFDVPQLVFRWRF